RRAPDPAAAGTTARRSVAVRRAPGGRGSGLDSRRRRPGRPAATVLAGMPPGRPRRPRRRLLTHTTEGETMSARLFCLLAIVLSRAAPARAEMRRPASDSAARLLADGNRYYKVRDFDKAIELYKQGALVEATPVFWYNLGQAFRQQAKYKEAI